MEENASMPRCSFELQPPEGKEIAGLYMYIRYKHSAMFHGLLTRRKDQRASL